MLDYVALAAECAPYVHTDTMLRVVSVESGGNPYAIGVVGARLQRQPRSLEEAFATVDWLEARGYNYSVGPAQVNKSNFKRHGLNRYTAFDACENIKAGSAILQECFARASRNSPEQEALRQAFSCYYSGNFITGFKQGYVLKIVAGGRIKPVKAQSQNANKPITPRIHASPEELAGQGAAASNSALLF